MSNSYIPNGQEMATLQMFQMTQMAKRRLYLKWYKSLRFKWLKHGYTADGSEIQMAKKWLHFKWLKNE